MYDDEVEALRECNTVGIILISALVIIGTFLMLEIIDLINKLSGNQPPCNKSELSYRYSGHNGTHPTHTCESDEYGGSHRKRSRKEDINFVTLGKIDIVEIPVARNANEKRTVANIQIYSDSLTGPESWGKIYPSCNGLAQSPVNIDTNTSTSIEMSEPLLWKNYDKTPVSMLLRNTGHTVQLTAQYMKGCEPTISGGALGDKTYMFQELNLRWGQTDNVGSEHTIDFERYALEMQLMHSSITNPDDIACVSYMFQISCNDNPLLNYLLNGLWEIISPGIAAWINPFPLRCILRTFSYKYYSYCGSLTYPPCTENVTWIINPERMSISSRQVAKLRKLHGREGPILMNSRPIQCINERLMYYFHS